MRIQDVLFTGGSESSENSDGRVENVRPTFQTGARTYREEVGSTALLLCKVNNLGTIFYNKLITFSQF
jgi:hypothetical protein